MARAAKRRTDTVRGERGGHRRRRWSRLAGDPTSKALRGRNTAVAGFWLRPALTVPGAYREPLTEMFGLLAAGLLSPLADTAYPLAEAPRALEEFLARRTTGKVILRTQA